MGPRYAQIWGSTPIRQVPWKPRNWTWQYLGSPIDLEVHLRVVQLYMFMCLWRSFIAFSIGEECVNVDQCPVRNMATRSHHLLTKVQQMKLMRSIFRCCAWLEKEWDQASPALCLGTTCGGWCLRSFHASPAQSSLCIMWMESWCSIKPWESKGLLENRQCCPALTYQQMCTLHGVMSVGSQLLRESLLWKVLRNLRD